MGLWKTRRPGGLYRRQLDGAQSADNQSSPPPPLGGSESKTADFCVQVQATDRGQAAFRLVFWVVFGSGPEGPELEG